MTPSKSFQVLGWLLSYPDGELFASWGELLSVLEGEGALAPSRLTELRRLFPVKLHVAEAPNAAATLHAAEAPNAAAAPNAAGEGAALLDAQETYSATFDGGRRTSLHLFEHVHGDGKQRGRALVELTERYAALGVQLRPGELPDYLPALCELASMSDGGRALLAETRPVLELLAQNLVERASPYASVVRALLDLLTPERALADATATSKHPAPRDGSLDVAAAPPHASPVAPSVDLEALDREWAEAPVEFGVAAAHDALVPLRRSRDAEARRLPVPQVALNHGNQP